MSATSSVAVISDASCSNECGQLGFVAGLIVDDVKKSSLFRDLNWSSSKLRRPVKLTGAAEILAAGYAIDDAKLLAAAYFRLLNLHIDVKVCVDSEDLYYGLATCSNAADKSIGADVAVVRYELETHNANRIIQIPGKDKYVRFFD